MVKFIKVHNSDHDSFLVNVAYIESVKPILEGKTLLFLYGYKKCFFFDCLESVDEILKMINA